MPDTDPTRSDLDRLRRLHQERSPVWAPISGHSWTPRVDGRGWTHDADCARCQGADD